MHASWSSRPTAYTTLICTIKKVEELPNYAHKLGSICTEHETNHRPLLFPESTEYKFVSIGEGFTVQDLIVIDEPEFQVGTRSIFLPPHVFHLETDEGK